MKSINLINQRFGRLLVIKKVGKDKHMGLLWECLCDCGNTKTVRGNNLRQGSTKSCGCLFREVISKTNKGRVASTKTRKKMSEAQQVIKYKKTYWLGKTGKAGPNWNPNITDEERKNKRAYPEYNGWRKEVYKLDNYTCQKCGQYSGNLNAHHIESYRANPTLRTEISNGITLCETCHKDFHHQYGYGNNTRAQLIEFLRGVRYGSK